MGVLHKKTRLMEDIPHYLFRMLRNGNGRINCDSVTYGWHCKSAEFKETLRKRLHKFEG